jgi:alpha-ketoglutarate-dependent taurine dioxygenase
MSTVATRITINRLHPLFVAEVIGLDCSAPMSREDFRTVWEAFNEHQILVFRDQHFDDESQIAFSRRFGDLETMIAHPGNDWNPGHISVMTNLGKDGDFLPPDHPAMIHRARNEEWHRNGTATARSSRSRRWLRCSPRASFRRSAATPISRARARLTKRCRRAAKPSSKVSSPSTA